MEKLNPRTEGTGTTASVHPASVWEIMEKVNEIIEWINSKKDQLL